MLIEIARGSVTNRGFIIEASKLRGYIKPDEELYKSYFSFDDKIREHIGSGRKSPSGYIGNYYLSQIILDIDKGSDSLERTIHRVKTLVTSLMEEYRLRDNLQVWFSGTGFHIHIPDIFDFKPSNDLPNIVRDTIENIFPDVDTKPIQSRGLIRVGYTINNKSGLYKTPIPLHELWFLTPEKVEGWATMQGLDIPLTKVKPLEKTFPNLIAIPKSKEVTIDKVRPGRHVTCMQHCYNAGPVEGHRHERILSMSSWLHRDGINEAIASAGMKAYAPSMDSYEVEKIVHDVYAGDGYNYGCDSKVMKQFCDPQCIHFSKKNYLPDVFGATEIEKAYTEEMKGNWQDGSLNLAPFLGITDPRGYWLRPGHVIGIVADTGLSKSILLANIALRYKDFGSTLFINTEMPHTELYERLMQIAHGKTDLEVREHHHQGRNTWSSAISHIVQCQTIPDYEGIASMVKSLKPKILMLDVVDDINYKGKRDIGAQEEMYTQISELTRANRMITFMVRHISKSAAQDEEGRSKRMTKHSAKGSGAFEDKCNVIIGIDGNPLQSERILRHLKGRSTTPFTARFNVSSDTFRYKLEAK